MLFGRRDKKKPNDRVLDLKARVDALRAADEATRAKPYSLDHFLEGDDVLTGRAVSDDYTPSGFDSADKPASPPDHEPDYHFEVNLEAELEKYLRRQEELSKNDATLASPEEAAPAEAPQRPVNNDWADSSEPPPVPDATADDGNWPSPGAGHGMTTPSRWDTSEWPPEEQWPPRRDEAV